MKRLVFALAPVLLLPAMFILVSCGGNGDSARLYFLALDLTEGEQVAPAGVAMTTALMIDVPGEPGSSCDSWQLGLTKLELLQEDNTPATVYEGDQYLETVGDGAGSVTGMVEGLLPDRGTYTQLRLTFDGERYRTKIVKEGTTYYTEDQTINIDDYWAFTTTEADYGVVDIIIDPVFVVIQKFPNPLIIDNKNDVNLVWVNEQSGIVTYLTNDSADINSTIWANDTPVVNTLLPDMPVKKVRFEITAVSGEYNTVTLLFNDSGQFLGGYNAGLDYENRIVNATEFRDGSVTFIENGGNAGVLDVNFYKSGSPGYYRLTGSYDCGLGTTGTYEDLTLEALGGADPIALTLNTTGPVSCTGIP